MSKKQHGGSRPGAGRKPRKDGRKSRLIRVMLSDQEFALVKDLTNPDDRRKILLDYVERFII